MKAAILIDGSHFLKRFGRLRPDIGKHDVEQAHVAIGELVNCHLDHLDKIQRAENPCSLLYRCFHYDAEPCNRQGHQPVGGKVIDYVNTRQSRFRRALFDRLRRHPNFAVRLGQVRRVWSWILSEKARKALLKGKWKVGHLTDKDFVAGLQQKAVDMRIGMDVASISPKKQADTIVLVTGDGDFVPAARLARREGVRIVLDPLAVER